MSEFEPAHKGGRVVIIGGGMTGAALALLLARALPEVKTVLVEAQPFTVDPDVHAQQSKYDARSTALSPGSVELLDQLGVWSAGRTYATAINNIHVSDRGHVGQVRFTPDDSNNEPLGYVVENRGLAQGLVGAVRAHPNIEVRAPHSVESVKPVAGGARVTLEQGVSLHADLVVCADGADSSVRQQLGIAEDVKDYRQCALVTNVAHSEPHGGWAYERFTETGPLALLPLGGEGGRYSALVWTWSAERAEYAMSLMDEAFLDLLQQRFGHRLGRFEKVGQRQSYPLWLRVAREQVRSGLVLLGNAAHFLHPVGGQGFNLSLRDAARLVEVLRQERDHPLGALATLQKYEQKQLSDQQRTIFLSDRFNQIFSRSQWAAAGLRNLGLLLLENNHVARQGLIRQLSGRGQARARPFT